MWPGAHGLREIRALGLLDLPGVVRILDEGLRQGQPFLVMERVPGAPLPGEGRRTWAAIEAPLRCLLHTLACVHEAGLVHRDIKPGKVLVNGDRAGDAALHRARAAPRRARRPAR